MKTHPNKSVIRQLKASAPFPGTEIKWDLIESTIIIHSANICEVRPPHSDSTLQPGRCFQIGMVTATHDRSVTWRRARSSPIFQKQPWVNFHIMIRWHGHRFLPQHGTYSGSSNRRRRIILGHQGDLTGCCKHSAGLKRSKSSQWNERRLAWYTGSGVWWRDRHCSLNTPPYCIRKVHAIQLALHYVRTKSGIRIQYFFSISAFLKACTYIGYNGFISVPINHRPIQSRQMLRTGRAQLARVQLVVRF